MHPWPFYVMGHYKFYIIIYYDDTMMIYGQ